MAAGDELLYQAAPLPVPAALLGESPFWHPDEASLYWCDIPGKRLNRYHPASGVHTHWDFDTEPASCAPLPGGELLLAQRDGLWRFDPHRNHHRRIAKPPYDTKLERYNDGKADPRGRYWVGTIHEPREPSAALYRYADGTLDRMADGITTSNGLAFSVDGRTLYWSDTRAHTIYAFDYDIQNGALSNRRVWCRFDARQPDQPLDSYGGRPDGAAVDSAGNYWVAMFEGQRLLQLAPDGHLLRSVPLPVRCPTMPCFGDTDLRTLYVTTSRENRPPDELRGQPWAGCVLAMRVEVPGLPVNFATL